MNFAEILFLLALDPAAGKIKPELERYLDCALAGALLMELALLNRLDTDLTCIRLDPQKESRDPLLLRVVDKKPTGDGLLDKALLELQQKAGPRPTREWLNHFSQEGQDIRRLVAEHLVSRGILKMEEKTILFFFKTRRYQIGDATEIERVKSRLRELVAGEEIPAPREVVLVELANSCGLFDEMFSVEELVRVRARINALLKLDLIGQAVSKDMREIQHSVTTEIHSA